MSHLYQPAEQKPRHCGAYLVQYRWLNKLQGRSGIRAVVAEYLGESHGWCNRGECLVSMPHFDGIVGWCELPPLDAPTDSPRWGSRSPIDFVASLRESATRLGYHGMPASEVADLALFTVYINHDETRRPLMAALVAELARRVEKGGAA